MDPRLCSCAASAKEDNIYPFQNISRTNFKVTVGERTLCFGELCSLFPSVMLPKHKVAGQPCALSCLRPRVCLPEEACHLQLAADKKSRVLSPYIPKGLGDDNSII